MFLLFLSNKKQKHKILFNIKFIMKNLIIKKNI